MKKRLFFVFILFFLSLFICYSDSAGKKTQTVQGCVIAKGNEPFVIPVILSDDGEQYTINTTTAAKKKKLLKLQGKHVKFTGYILDNGSFEVKKYKILKK